MEIKKGSDLILILHIEDIKGKPLRVADTADFKLYVWTSNRNNYLTFKKRDLLLNGNVDRVAIPDYYMNTLETGVVCYTYDYAIRDSAFQHTDCMYNKVKEVVTDFNWVNSNYNEIPANPINYQTLEYLKDLIEDESIKRTKAIGELKHYVECEYTDRLADEIKRSNEVDIEMHKLIKANKADSDSADKAIEDKLNEEIRRSNEVDMQLHKLIKENKEGASDKIDEATNTLNTALNNEISRATTKENEIATNLTTEINRVTAEITTTRDSIESESNRAKAAEKLLTDSLNAEIDRAIQKENSINSKVNELVENLGDEIERSLEKDREHKQELDIESNRAKAEENRIDTALTIEVDRAKAKEESLTGAITSEVERAKTVEKDITDALKALKTSVADKNTEVTDSIKAESDRAKAAEKALTDKADELNTAISDEVTRAKGEEKALNDTLNAEITRSTNEDKAIKDSITGINQAATALSDKVDGEISRATAKENELKNSIDTTNTAVSNEVSRATAKEADIVASVDALTTTVANEVKRSTDKDAELTKAVSDMDAEVKANATSINTINQKLDVINGEGIGSINHAVEDSKHYTDDEIAKIKASTSTDLTNTLKEYATKADVDGRIKDVIGTAPEALDTLGEIAEVLNGNGDAIDAINGVLSGKANSADVYTKAEMDATVTAINSDITAESSRAKSEEARVENLVKAASADLITEVNRAKAAEKEVADAVKAEGKRSTDADVANTAAINAEVSRATDAEKVLSDKIDRLNGDASTVGSVAHSLEDAKHYTDDEVNKAKADADAKYQPKGDYLTAHQDISGLATKGEVTAEANRAKAAESDITDNVTALRTALKNSMKVENETLIITL